MNEASYPTSLDNHEESKSERDGLSDCEEIVSEVEMKDSEEISGDDGYLTDSDDELRHFVIECEGCMAEPEVDDDKLCVRCKNFPWKSLVDDGPHGNSMVLAIPQERDELLQSACRIGRFFGTVKERHGNPYDNHGYHRVRNQVELKSQTYVFRLRDFAGSESFIVTGLRPEIAQSSLRHLYPQQPNSHLLSTWLETCAKNHGIRCEPSSSGDLTNLRFIDCKSRTVTRSPPNPRFLALSYVWGSQPTTIHQMNDLLSNLPEKLPQVIDDAVSLTLSLGYQYLWVDRYCIDQYDDQAKEIQIMQMADIYAAAQIGIFACASAGAEAGLPGVSSESRGIQPHLESLGNLSLINYPSKNSSDLVLDTPWASRGWTFQECYFSRRRLFFTDCQVIFVCNTKTGYEMQHELKNVDDDLFSNDDHDRDLFHGIIPGEAGVSWRIAQRPHPILRAIKVLERYTARVLTFESDALNAIIGALSTFRKYGINHSWGVPFTTTETNNAATTIGHALATPPARSEVYMALLWYHADPIGRRPGFPSWSPLGWKGKVNFPHKPTTQVRIHWDMASREIQDERETIKDQRPLSQYLQLDARVAYFDIVRGPVHSDSDSSDNTSIALSLDVNLYIVCRVIWDIVPEVPVEGKHAYEQLKGIFLSAPNSLIRDAKGYVMILAQHGTYYERIGLSQLPSPHNLVKRHRQEYRVEFQDGSGNRYDDEDLEQIIPHFKDGTPWWSKYSKPETIILG